jgi:hypothetical protein
VLGSDGYGRGVTARSWDDLAPGLNVADYEVVILDFATLDRSDLAGRLNRDSIPTAEQFARLSLSGGSIYGIGNPQTQLSDVHQAQWWFPLQFQVAAERGEIVEHIDKWDFWFERNRGFEWVLAPTQAVAPAWRFGHQPSPGTFGDVIASTRYQQPISIEAGVELAGRGPTGVSYWLPLPSQLSPQDAVALLLAERLGIGDTAERPTWITKYSLPDERRAEEALKTAVNATDAARAAEADAKARVVGEQRFQALLYASGDELELVVHAAFEYLGATLEAPTVAREDGRLVDPSGRRAILEVKGIKAAVGVEHVRQLQGWALDAIADGWEGKAVLVVNAHRAFAPDARPEPVADSAEKFAVRTGTAIVTTSQIFEALRQRQLDESNASEFWDAIFQADGCCSHPAIAFESSSTSTEPAKS